MTSIDSNPSSITTPPSKTYDEIVSDLLALIRAQTKDAGKEWGPQTTMQETGIDSFDFVELVYEVEDKYGIDLNFNANTADDLKTVADVAALIHARITEKRSAT